MGGEKHKRIFPEDMKACPPLSEGSVRQRMSEFEKQKFEIEELMLLCAGQNHTAYIPHLPTPSHRSVFRREITYSGEFTLSTMTAVA